MKRIFALALAALALSAPAMGEPREPIDTGLWEAHTVFLGLIGKTERWCIKPADIAKFLSGPSNHIYHCTYPENSAEAGKIHFKGTCVDKKGQTIKLQGDGDYTETAMHMKASGSTQWMGIPIGGGATADAHFISADCPAGSKSFK